MVAKVYRELGHELLYWADTYADDLPYWTTMPGGKKEEGLVMMPYSLDCVSGYQSDRVLQLTAFHRTTSSSGKDKLDRTMLSLSTVSTLSRKLLKAFRQRLITLNSTIREEGLEGKSAYITVALHSRWIGRPGRFQALKRMVEHFSSFDDVWFATREDIARHWKETYPYEPKV